MLCGVDDLLVVQYLLGTCVIHHHNTSNVLLVIHCLRTGYPESFVPVCCTCRDEVAQKSCCPVRDVLWTVIFIFIAVIRHAFTHWPDNEVEDILARKLVTQAQCDNFTHTIMLCFANQPL